MQFPIKNLSLALMIAGLTACGGGGDGGKKSSSSAANAPIPSSSSQASVSVSSSLASSSAASSVAAPSVSVVEIKDCGLNETKADNAYTIFADYDVSTQNQMLLNFSGWNHATNGSATEWVNLKLPGSTYNFNSAAKVNDSCNGVDALNIVLVKKIADWDHQHANGFEKTITSDGKKFGDIKNLVLDLKINSAKTFIPTVASLKSTYSPTYVNQTKIDSLDSGKVNIGITIYDGKSSTVLSASYIIELDQATVADKWVRVTIPVAAMKFCSTTNYNCSNRTLADLNSTVIAGIIFVAETKSGEVLRGDIAGWSSAVPETFKEVDVSFKKIEFQL
ncbi:MAG: hypothetical protein ABW044_07445 [Cellvibrio sp.]